MNLPAAARLLACRLTLAVVALIVGVPDRLLGTDPRGLVWVPEGVDEGEVWET